MGAAFDKRDPPAGAGRPSAAAAAFLRRVIGPITRALFRPVLVGTEHLPADGPYLLVSNHNAGLGIAELTSFAALWSERFGSSRALAAFAHPLGFKIWPMTAINRSVGSIPSTYEAAYAALDEGVPILVFPGGDHETFRPVWQASRVDFGGRKGFLRIAARSGVPVVPMGIAGSHYTAPILLRSRALAWLLVVPRLFGVKRWAISVLSVAGCCAIAMLPFALWVRVLLAWLWCVSPLIFLPWVPWTIRMTIGEPLDLGLEPAPTDAQLTDALAAVEARIQQLLRPAC